MSDNKTKCEICLKKDNYQMCPNCFIDIRNLAMTLKKNNKQETYELRDSLKELMNKNKAKSSQLAQSYYTQLQINSISNEIEGITAQNNSQREKIGRIKQEIENKKKKIMKIKEKLKETKANTCLPVNQEDYFKELMLQLTNRKINYLKSLFNIFIINSKAYIPIQEYFINNDHYFTSMNANHNLNQKKEDEEMFNNIIKYENVMKICTETANGKFQIEDQMILPTEIFPFKILPSILKNRIKCIKLNRFLVAMMTFVYYSAEKIKICLPHLMTPFYIQSNKNNKTLNGIIEQATIRKNNLEDIMNLVNLLNQNYTALIDIVYHNQRYEIASKEGRKPIELFNLTPLMSPDLQDEQLKRSNSELIQLKTDTEVEGFIVLNDYFH